MGAAVAENIYGKYSIPTDLSHRHAVRLIKRGEVYEPNTIKFMREHAGDGDIIHAGTFFGDFLPALSPAMAKGAKVWAFEPHPNSYEHAGRTIELNALENVELHNKAVSDKSDVLFFRTHKPDGEALGGKSFITEADGDGVEPVESIRLDEFVPLDRKVTILQLDVEGHERAALLGAMGLIERWAPILILENFEKPRWMKKNLGHMDYRVVGQRHRNFVYATTDLKIED